ncbi:MAG: hypothetical protein ABIW76_04525 [Fibrobacteria bacterium]
MRIKLFVSALVGLGLTSLHAGDPKFKVHGGAWTDYGRIGKASDSLLPGGDPSTRLNLNGNTLMSVGAQVTLVADLTEHFEGAFGFGAHRVNHAMGRGQKSFLTIAMFHHFLTESRLTWYSGDKAESPFSFTLGSFPYKYNRDAHNLGLYLFRGPVYPGILMGGWGDFATDTTKSTQLGAKASMAIGEAEGTRFSLDLILNSERDLPPTFDWSLGGVAKAGFLGAIEVGAGVNFYRLVPYDKRLQTPGKLSDRELGIAFRSDYIEVDPLDPTDTVFFTHQGVKVMGLVSVDFKPLLGLKESMSKDDFKIYGEAAILGLKDYGKTYGDIMQRMPMMVGFNVPTFGLLDKLSFEVERYTTPYRNDLANIGNNNMVADWTSRTPLEVPIPSPKPVTNADYKIDAEGRWINAAGDTVRTDGTGLSRENVTSDDIKWSLLLEKTFSKHIRLSGQVANDHYRPRPVATGLIASSGGVAEAFSESSNWYFMLRMGYFF